MIMTEYVKVNTIWKRDHNPGMKNRVIEGEWAIPEFEMLQDIGWTWTEKNNGVNTRVHIMSVSDPDRGPSFSHVYFGGRTNDAQISVHLLNHMDSQFKSMHGLEKLGEVCPHGGMILYGEGIGDKVLRASGKYGFDANFVLFDVLAAALAPDGSDQMIWLARESVEDIAAKLEIPCAQVIGHGTLLEAADAAREGFSSAWGIPAEGLVMRPSTELQTRRGERIIAKIKTRDFLA